MIPDRTRLPLSQLRASLSSPSLRRCALVGSVFGLGCMHLVLAIASIQHKSATYDEVAHVTAGYTYWKQNDYRLHPENGNIPQRWMTLPLIALSPDLEFPGLRTEAWRRSNLWQLGDEFFHNSGNRVEDILLPARTAVALMSVALCMLVFIWSRSLFGNFGGLISLVLCVFSPTVMAHGRLATSDLFTTFFFAASAWSVWALLHRVSIWQLLAGTLAVSGLFLCKTSAVLILPMAAVMALISLVPRQSISLYMPKGRRYELTSQWSRRGCVLVITLFIGVAAYSSVWAAYGFRYAASLEGDHEYHQFQDIDTVAQHSGRVGRTVKWLADRRVLPEAYLYGVAFVAAHEERPAFLNGQYETRGWSHFFPYCLAVKTPLAVLGLLALGTIALPVRWVRRRVKRDEESSRERLAYHLTPIAIPLLILWTVFLGTQLNIGHRHILPTYPFMFILAGAAANWCRKESRVLAAATGLLLMWLVSDSLASYPHYLSYFNQLVPREKAYQHLVDSSLDWGQDLPSLKTWLDQHATDAEPVFLGYFGTASPAYYGIDAQPLPLMGMGGDQLELTPGVYCVSATCLQAVYGFASGRWNQQYEARYQELRTLFETGEDDPTDTELRLQFDALKARRLATYLRHRDPDANVGFSILIYRLTTDDLHLALAGPPAELDKLSWAMRRLLQAEQENR
ncbi:MAG: glycosyltransferase family 39 protein [Planctomycetes bacterium]|nr:glycosyltransferase family 39 protein [Planctomycetota bacterium]